MEQAEKSASVVAVENFLAECGVTVEAKLVPYDGKLFGWDKFENKLVQPGCWEITVKKGRASFTERYSAGVGHRRWKPSSVDGPNGTRVSPRGNRLPPNSEKLGYGAAGQLPLYRHQFIHELATAVVASKKASTHAEAQDKVREHCRWGERLTNTLDWLTCTTPYYRRLTEEFIYVWSDPDIDSIASPIGAFMSEASGPMRGESFEEWCANYGADPDSRKALASYETGQALHVKMLRVFSGSELEKLAELCNKL